MMHRVRYGVFASVLFLCGCLAPNPRLDVTLVGSLQELPSIQEANAQRLAQLSIGIDLDGFRQIFPEAYVGGQSGSTTAYEVSKKTKYALRGEWNPYYSSVQELAIKTDIQVLWFYFYEGVLVKWGRPQDWPERPTQSAKPGGPSRSPAGETGQPKPRARGSGFVLATQGIVVTNWHVIENASRIELVTARGTMTAKVAAADRDNDLAVLKTDQPLPAALAIIPSRGIKLGADVFTIGFPNPELQGWRPKFTRGDISSLAGPSDNPRYFQISVPVQPGNSGGPLCDKAGRVIGVITAKLDVRAALKSSGALPENVNYAVKSSYLLALLESLDLPADAFVSGKDNLTRDDANALVEKAAVLVLVY